MTSQLRWGGGEDCWCPGSEKMTVKGKGQTGVLTLEVDYCVLQALMMWQVGR
jgi:hypothetical protein